MAEDKVDVLAGDSIEGTPIERAIEDIAEVQHSDLAKIKYRSAKIIRRTL